MLAKQRVEVSEATRTKVRLPGDAVIRDRSQTPVWHHVRQPAILKAHPEIRELFRSDRWSALYCLFTVSLQTVIAVIVAPMIHQYTVSFYLATYWISGTLNHSLTFAIHELSHDAFFATRTANKIFGLVANLPLVFPVAATFNRYHGAHHAGLNTEGADMDLPSEWECKTLDNVLGRLVWVIFQQTVYALRPLIVKPKLPSMWQVVNLITQISYCLVIYNLAGPHGIQYLLLGTLLGMSLHPVSGHFMAEHYEFFAGQETTSYYGFLNLVTYNVGYHVEHHDFPRIPGRRLPELRKIAPEFYNHLQHHSSWVAVLWEFVRHGSLRNRLRRRLFM